MLPLLVWPLRPHLTMYLISIHLMQSNCGGYELLFFTTMDGAHVNSPSALKDCDWYSYTCTLGW